MKKSILIALTMLTVALFVNGTAISSEGDKHGKGHAGNAKMQKLHGMMPTYAVIQAKINGALEKGDSSAVVAEAGKILATTAELKKAKPHKNRKQLKLFREMATDFEKEVKATAELAGKGDLTGARAAFVKAGKKCDECHAKFRE